MDLVNLKAGNAAAIGLLGYCVVFVGLILLMVVVMILGKIMISKAKKAQPVAAAAEAPAVEEKKSLPVAPGSAGDIKLYDTEPRDAAMIMAIVANKMGKPLNELRFKSIREVKKQ